MVTRDAMAKKKSKVSRRGGLPLEMFHKLNIYAAAGQQLRHSNLSSISSSNINKKKETATTTKGTTSRASNLQTLPSGKSLFTKTPRIPLSCSRIVCFVKGCCKSYPLYACFPLYTLPKRIAGLPEVQFLTKIVKRFEYELNKS